MTLAGGNVQTVLGERKLSALGRTLTHEHLSLDFTDFYVPPPNHLKRFFDGTIDLRKVGFVNQYPYSSIYNVTFNDTESADAILEDLKLYREFGGGTIVENSSHGLKRDIPLMKRFSAETDINVIAGTGHYVAATQSPSELSMSAEEMYNLIIKEMTLGCEGSPDVKAGFIGEVGSTWPIDDFEKRAIQATGEAQAHLRCSVSFHPGRNAAAPSEIMRIYQEAGGESHKAIMSHIDRTLTAEDSLLEFADDTGCYCQFDLFGIECSFYQLAPTIDMPSDAQRIEFIKLLRDNGKLNRVLLSHDIHTKHRLITFGGHGYAHILNNVLPKMKIKDFTQKEIDLLTIKNPQEWLLPKSI